MKNEMNITVEQLRRLLFNIDNQEMTVKELRSRLFDVANQEQKVTDEFNFFKKIGVEQ